MLTDLWHLFFPKVCLLCGKPLFVHEKTICHPCIYKLPKTNFHESPKQNGLIHFFYGRCPIEQAICFFYYAKKSKTQQLIHLFKYQGFSDIGYTIGVLYGRTLLSSSFELPDILIPVPLHKDKLKKRGYNQSTLFAEGLASILERPLLTSCLARLTPSNSQTTFNRYKRWENSQATYMGYFSKELENKHVLLVDDLITTGATIEACALALLKENPTIKISVIALGYTA